MLNAKSISAIAKIATLTLLGAALLQASPNVADGDAMLGLSAMGLGCAWCAGMYDTSGKKGFFAELLLTMAALPAIISLAFFFTGSSWEKMTVMLAVVIGAQLLFVFARSRFAGEEASIASRTPARRRH